MKNTTFFTVLHVLILGVVTQLGATTAAVDSADISGSGYELLSFVAGGRTYTQQDLVQPSLTAFSWANNPPIVVPHGAIVPPQGSRSLVLTGDFSLGTGLFQTALGAMAATITFASPLVNGPGPDLIMFEFKGPDSFQVQTNSRTVLYDRALYDKPLELIWVDEYARNEGLPADIGELENGTYSLGSPVSNETLPVFGIAIDLDDFALNLLDAVSTVHFGSYDGNYVDPVLFMGINSTLVPLLGDMDCDGDVDFDDIDYFVLGLNDAITYESMFGLPPQVKGDTDQDGDFDFDDIVGFAELLGTTGNVNAVPEPSAFSLSMLCVAGIAVATAGMRGARCRRRETRGRVRASESADDGP